MDKVKYTNEQIKNATWKELREMALNADKDSLDLIIDKYIDSANEHEIYFIADRLERAVEENKVEDAWFEEVVGRFQQKLIDGIDNIKEVTIDIIYFATDIKYADVNKFFEKFKEKNKYEAMIMMADNDVQFITRVKKIVKEKHLEDLCDRCLVTFHREQNKETEEEKEE